MWFMILAARYEINPKATVWNGSEKSVLLAAVLIINACVLYSHSDYYESFSRYLPEKQIVV